MSSAPMSRADASARPLESVIHAIRAIRERPRMRPAEVYEQGLSSARQLYAAHIAGYVRYLRRCVLTWFRRHIAKRGDR